MSKSLGSEIADQLMEAPYPLSAQLCRLAAAELDRLHALASTDADAMRKALEDIRDAASGDKQVSGGLLWVYEKARTALASAGDGWVRVEDGLPEELLPVLWCRVPVVEPPHVASSCELSRELDGYTHWRPLPPAPKQ